MDAFWTVMVVIVGLAARLALVALVLSAMTVVVWLALALFEGLKRAGGGAYARDVDHAPTHLWLRCTARGAFRIGLDDFVRRLLPRLDGVAVVSPGSLVRAGEPLAWLRLGTRTLEVPSPTTGEVVAARRAGAPLRAGGGWLADVSPSGEATVACLRGEPAQRWLRDEQRALMREVEAELGLAAADGGQLVEQGFAALSDARRLELVERLFARAQSSSKSA